MNKQEIINFLSVKKGYLKYGKAKLASMFQSDVETVKQAIEAIRSSFNPKDHLDTKEEQSVLKTIADKNLMNFEPELLEKFRKWHKALENNEKSIIVRNELKFKTGIHLIGGCQHIPFHNKNMLNGMLNLIQDLGTKLSGLHILGDFLDLNSLSAHDRGCIPISGITLGKEYNEGNKVLDLLESAIGNNNISKTYIYGNHEDRYHRHIIDSDNNKFSDALLSPKDALKLESRGYKVYTNWKEDFHQLGNHLQLIHGEYCSKSPARTHMDKLKSSAIFAHTHRVDIVYDGEKAGFNIGWGGDKDAKAFGYVSRITKMNWINGFALVTIDEQGYFHTQVITVYKDKFWYNGKCY